MVEAPDTVTLAMHIPDNFISPSTGAVFYVIMIPVWVLCLRANTQARQMAESMVCRGFDGTYRIRHERLLTWRNAVYVVCIASMIALAVYSG